MRKFTVLLVGMALLATSSLADEPGVEARFSGGHFDGWDTVQLAESQDLMIRNATVIILR